MDGFKLIYKTDIQNQKANLHENEDFRQGVLRTGYHEKRRNSDRMKKPFSNHALDRVTELSRQENALKNYKCSTDTEIP